MAQKTGALIFDEQTDRYDSTAASAASRKKPILRRIRPLSSGATATRQSATAREPPARNGKPPKSGADTLTPWKN